MKKIINIIACLLITLTIIIPYKVFAATGSYVISSSNTVEIGNTFSVKFTIKASKLFYWQSYITYDTTKLELVSGSTNFQGESDNASTGQGSVTKTLKFKAKKKGSTWVAIAMGNKENNINADIQEISFKKVVKDITIKEKEVITYSSNNNLKGLSVEGYNIAPTFNNNTLEYSIDLPANTQEIKINATKEDSKASISGDGTVKLSEGINKLSIKVTAENGNVKTYIINANVKELDPIEVTIDKKSYTVIRKKEQLPKVSSTYADSTAKINEEEVPALTSEITKYTLVGLKDEAGNVALYVYDKNAFKKYQEVAFNKLTIFPIDNKSKVTLPRDYKQTSITINNEKVSAYKAPDSYPIFVGLNIETGEENLYSYDQKENTIQRFTPGKGNSNMSASLMNADQDLYTYTIVFLGMSLLITYLVILTNLIKKNRKTKTIGLS